jgi:hypothetical protein
MQFRARRAREKDGRRYKEEDVSLFLLLLLRKEEGDDISRDGTNLMKSHKRLERWYDQGRNGHGRVEASMHFPTMTYLMLLSFGFFGGRVWGYGSRDMCF